MGTYCVTVSYPDDIRGLVRDAFGINSLPSDNTQLGDTTIEGDTEESTENGDHSDEGVSYKRLLEESSQNKKVESYKKQVETQDLQMKNMDQKLNEVYGMLKLFPAFPDLDNVASTSAAGTCDN
nr:basic helix-loop-helix leucine zipper transcription factor [Tanacetum cinerariifolium]